MSVCRTPTDNVFSTDLPGVPESQNDHRNVISQTVSTNKLPKVQQHTPLHVDSQPPFLDSDSLSTTDPTHSIIQDVTAAPSDKATATSKSDAPVSRDDDVLFCQMLASLMRQVPEGQLKDKLRLTLLQDIVEAKSVGG